MKKNTYPLKAACFVAIFLLAVITVACLYDRSKESEKTEDLLKPLVVEEDYLVIYGDQYTIKQDLTRGGAICYISKAGSELNFVNIRDEGRYIQQSYYAGQSLDRTAEGQSKNWSPWPWNPIQVGDYVRNRAQILSYGGSADSTYVKCVPMLWDMAGEPAEAEMEQWTKLDGNVLTVKCCIKCHCSSTKWEDADRDQEIPAVYLVGEFSNLYATLGSTGFKTTAMPQKLEVVNLKANGHWGVYDSKNRGNVPEHWMAFVDDEGFGVGVYSPTATKFLAGEHHYADETGKILDATSYISPLRVEKLSGNSTMDYTYYLIFGTVDEIRDVVYRMNGIK